MVIIRGNGNIVAGGNVVVHGNNCVIANGVAVNCVVGNGKVKADRRPLEKADEIILDGPISLTFTRGANLFMRVTGDENILPLIVTKVAENALFVRCSAGFTTKNEIHVEVEMPSLGSLTAKGSGSVLIDSIEQPAFCAELDGSGVVSITGKVDHFTAELNGSGDIFANRLRARAAVLSLNGSGNINTCVSDSVKAKLNGSGDIVISGAPAQRDCRVNGSGEINFD